MAGLLRDAIESRLDPAAWADMLAREEAERVAAVNAIRQV
jgi:hypothetical protein